MTQPEQLMMYDPKYFENSNRCSSPPIKDKFDMPFEVIEE
jgi:hypothetical protein